MNKSNQLRQYLETTKRSFTVGKLQLMFDMDSGSIDTIIREFKEQNKIYVSETFTNNQKRYRSGAHPITAYIYSCVPKINKVNYRASFCRSES